MQMMSGIDSKLLYIQIRSRIHFVNHMRFIKLENEKYNRSAVFIFMNERN